MYLWLSLSSLERPPTLVCVYVCVCVCVCVWSWQMRFDMTTLTNTCKLLGLHFLLSAIWGPILYSLVDPLLACWVYFWTIDVFHIFLIRDYNLCCNGSPYYIFSYYNYKSVWPYYVYSYSHHWKFVPLGANSSGSRTTLYFSIRKMGWASFRENIEHNYIYKALQTTTTDVPPCNYVTVHLLHKYAGNKCIISSMLCITWA